MKQSKGRMVAVVGPTGSGKTKLAIHLAKKFNGVIISADSRQVYRGLDIGTNKEGTPGRCDDQPCRTIDGIGQLLIDIVDPGERFTLHDWLLQARYWLEPIMEKGQLPIIVGGTGLYVTALLEGYKLGGGRGAKNNQAVDFESLILMPDIDRVVLNEKSDKRFVKIFDDLIAETKRLLESGVSDEWLEKIGLDYRYAHRNVSGQLSRKEAIEQFQTAKIKKTRRKITGGGLPGKEHTPASAAEASSLVSRFLKG